MITSTKYESIRIYESKIRHSGGNLSNIKYKSPICDGVKLNDMYHCLLNRLTYVSNLTSTI